MLFISYLSILINNILCLINIFGENAKSAFIIYKLTHLNGSAKILQALYLLDFIKTQKSEFDFLNENTDYKSLGIH